MSSFASKLAPDATVILPVIPLKALPFTVPSKPPFTTIGPANELLSAVPKMASAPLPFSTSPLLPLIPPRITWLFVTPITGCPLLTARVR